ncbi:hypothetical protein L7F22_050258 [Adiantum nelumboides]|nr:hypothetical protein [Adiantum nelumboides]
MGLIDELDRLSTDQNSDSVAGPSKSRECGTNANRNKDRRSSSKSKVVSDHSEDEGDINPAQIANMGMDKLRKEVSKYGFRPSKSRKLMIEQLENVYEAIRNAKQRKVAEGGGDTSSLLSSSPPSSMLLLQPETPTIARNTSGKGRKAANKLTNSRQAKEVVTIELDSDISGLLDEDGTSSAENDDPVEMGDLTMAMMRESERETRQKSPHSSKEDLGEESEASNSTGSDDESDDEALANRSLRGVIRTSTANQATALGSVPAEVAQQLHDAIMSDEDLYRRILLFEPISFDEVNSLAKKAGIQGLRSKETLRNWLDVQCICFYSTELTGQRQRY